MSRLSAKLSRPTAASEPGLAKKLIPSPRSEHRPRPAWRQQLVSAERGLSHSLRADSALYLHLFFDTLLLATCGVLGLSATHWIIVGMALTLMLTSELFAQGLTALASEMSNSLRKQVVSIAAAGKLLAVLGSTSAVSIVMLLRIRELFS